MTELPVLLAARTAYGARGLHAILAEIKLILGLAVDDQPGEVRRRCYETCMSRSHQRQKKASSPIRARTATIGRRSHPESRSSSPTGDLGINLIDTGWRRTRAGKTSSGSRAWWPRRHAAPIEAGWFLHRGFMAASSFARSLLLSGKNGVRHGGELSDRYRAVVPA